MICSIDLDKLLCKSCTDFQKCECLKEFKSKDEFQKLFFALTSCGFIQILNHGIDNEVIKRAIQSSTSFFSCPLNQKSLHISKDKARRGYSPIATENFATLIGESDKPNDTVEKFRIGPIITANDKQSDMEYFGHKEAKVHFFENDWRDLPPDFERNITEYYKHMEKLSQSLLKIIEIAMGLESSYFERLTDKHTSILSLNHYPPLTADLTGTDNNVHDSQCAVRVAEHTDVSMLTIVAQSINNTDNTNISTDSSPYAAPSVPPPGGLEIFDPSTSRWLSVPYVPGGLVVNVGDCLSDWSGGRLRSARHRVVTRQQRTGGEEEEERYSLAYFLAPNYDALMSWPEDPSEGSPISVAGTGWEENSRGGGRGGRGGRGETDTHSVSEQRREEEEAVSYTTWRKSKIKRALQRLNKSSNK
jgi:isopenicillin N synthase-like dioxygenase